MRIIRGRIVDPRAGYRLRQSGSVELALRLLPVLQVGDFVFENVRDDFWWNPGWLHLINLSRREAWVFRNSFLSILVLIEYLVGLVEDKFKITEIVHLLLVVMDALVFHCVAYKAELRVNIVTRQKDEFQPLVANLVFLDTRNGQLIA